MAVNAGTLKRGFGEKSDSRDENNGKGYAYDNSNNNGNNGRNGKTATMTHTTASRGNNGKSSGNKRSHGGAHGKRDKWLKKMEEMRERFQVISTTYRQETQQAFFAEEIP